MLKILIGIYLIFYSQIILHELGHYIVACIGHLGVERICIGNQIASLTIGTISVSPILWGGYVEVVEADLMKKSRLFVILFFEGGSFMNLISSLLCFCFGRGILGFAFMLVGVLIALISNIILLPGSDLHDCRMCLRKKIDVY